MQSIWHYLRTKTCEAVLAGFHDAIAEVTKGEANGIEASAEMFRKLNNTQTETQKSEIAAQPRQPAVRQTPVQPSVSQPSVVQPSVVQPSVVQTPVVRPTVVQASSQPTPVVKPVPHQVVQQPVASRAVQKPQTEVVSESTVSRLTGLEGIGRIHSEKLCQVGIYTIDQLLEKGSTNRGRKALAEQTGISTKLILKWVNRADLSRVNGIGETYADLLESAGVDTVPELAQRNADNLHKKLGEVNERRKVVSQLPTPTTVTHWIQHAKELPRVITY